MMLPYVLPKQLKGNLRKVPLMVSGSPAVQQGASTEMLLSIWIFRTM